MRLFYKSAAVRAHNIRKSPERLTDFCRCTVLTKANPNSRFQEIRKLLSHQEIREIARKSPGKYLNSAGNLVYLRLRCSGVSHKRRKYHLLVNTFFFLEIPGKKSRFWSIYGKTVYYYQEFTRKLLESHPESGSGNKNPAKDFCWWDLDGVCSSL